jgi:hypothetical protein
MPTETTDRVFVPCQNCDARATKLGRLLWITPSGKWLYLNVCRFCFAQLQPKQEQTIRR